MAAWRFEASPGTSEALARPGVAVGASNSNPTVSITQETAYEKRARSRRSRSTTRGSPTAEIRPVGSRKVLDNRQVLHISIARCQVRHPVARGRSSRSASANSTTTVAGTIDVRPARRVENAAETASELNNI